MGRSLLHVVGILAVMLFGLAGCGGDGGGNTTVSTYTPVTAGTTWSYSRSDNGTRTEKILANSNNQVTREVVDSTTGRSVATELNSNKAAYLATVDLYNAAGSISATKTYSPSPGMLFVPSSTTPGSHETQNVQINTMPTNTNTSLSTDISVVGVETITVPAGTFENTLKIQTTILPSTTYTTWFAINVGMIRQDVNTVKSIELTSYSIK